MTASQETVFLQGHIIDSLILAKVLDTIVMMGGTFDLKAGAECGFRGERRALRVRLNDLAWSLDGSVLTLSFWLPPGSYATSVLREVVKANA